MGGQATIMVGGAPHHKINTRACGNPSLPSTERSIVRNKITKSFLKDGKRSLDKGKEKPSGPNLAWWTTWWNRVEKEADKERILARTTTKITAFARITSREEKMFPKKVFLTDSRSGDVIHERHSDKNDRKIDTPKLKPTHCVAKPVSGRKRTLEGGIESPAKSSQSYAFNNLLQYWDGPAEKLSNQDFTYKKIHTSLKHATHPADTDGADQDSEIV
jgi:hypothetical protein